MKRPEAAQSEVRAAKRSRRGSLTLGAVVAALAATLLAPAGALAQGDGPGAQILFPVGTNIFVPTWLNMEMNSDLSQSVLRLDADVDADVLLGIYQRGFAIGDRFAEIWVVPMWADLGAQVDVARAGGGTVTRSVSESGFGDPYLAFKIGLVGAPALTLPEFMKHKPTFQLYAYGGVYVPIGDYDGDRLLNFGTNRWAYRLGLPMVLPLGDPKRQTNLEIHPGFTFYGDNDEPGGGAADQEQDPLFQVESHLSTHWNAKWWSSIGLRYRKGGETSTDGVADGNEQDVLGGEVTMGYAFTPRLGLQTTYGDVLAESDGSQSTMIRVRLNYVF